MQQFDIQASFVFNGQIEAESLSEAEKALEYIILHDIHSLKKHGVSTITSIIATKPDDAEPKVCLACEG